MQLLATRPEAAEFEIHPKRVQVRLRDRVYPIEDRSETFPRKIPQEFASLVDVMTANHTLFKLNTQNKDEIYEHFNKSVELLNTWRDQFAAFLTAVFACNTIIRSHWMKSDQKHQIMMKRSERWSVLLDGFRHQRPAVLRADLLKDSPNRIIHEVQHAIRKAAEDVVIALFNVLDSGVGLEHIGLINWSSDDICRFHYFLYEVDDELVSTSQSLLGERTEETETTTRKIQTNVKERKLRATFRNTRCVHEVVGAKNHALPAAGVKMPGRVTELLKKVPDPLKSMMRIVTGTEVYRLTIARDEKTEDRTDVEHEDVLVSEEPRFHPDPAVVLGWFVLTGWGEEETNV